MVAIREYVDRSGRSPFGRWLDESRIDFGPGYRVYFGKDGETLVVLLGGGTKKRQGRDIQDALNCWADYKRRKETH